MEGQQQIKLFDDAIDQLYLKIGDLLQIKIEVSNMKRSRLGFICDENSNKFGRKLFTISDVSDFFAKLDAEISMHENRISELEALKREWEHQPETSSTGSASDGMSTGTISPLYEHHPNVASKSLINRTYLNRASNQGTNWRLVSNSCHLERTTSTQMYLPQRQNGFNNHRGNQFSRYVYNEHSSNYPNNGGKRVWYDNDSYSDYNGDFRYPPKMIKNVYTPNRYPRNTMMNYYNDRPRTLKYLTN